MDLDSDLDLQIRNGAGRKDRTSNVLRTVTFHALADRIDLKNVHTTLSPPSPGASPVGAHASMELLIVLSAINAKPSLPPLSPRAHPEKSGPVF